MNVPKIKIVPPKTYYCGYEARCAGYPRDENPYEHDTREHEDWDEGWQSAEYDLTFYPEEK